MKHMRTLGLTMLGLLVTACDQPVPAPDNAEDAGNAANASAGPDTRRAPQPEPSPELRSIMQPEVRTIEIPKPVRPLTGTVHFDESGTDLDDEARALLDDWLDERVTASGGQIILRGSTDSKGDDDKNIEVSKKRAEAVADYLATHGIARERIAVIALGEGRPAQPNVKLDGSDNPEGRSANRRVDVEILPGPQEKDASAPADGARTARTGTEDE